jgi:hypothetical protein
MNKRAMVSTKELAQEKQWARECFHPGPFALLCCARLSFAPLGCTPLCSAKLCFARLRYASPRFAKLRLLCYVLYGPWWLTCREK